MLAIQYFNQAIKARPYLADPYFLRAFGQLNLEDYKGAGRGLFVMPGTQQVQGGSL